VAPVINEAPGDRRKHTALDTSSTVPVLFAGIAGFAASKTLI